MELLYSYKFWKHLTEDVNNSRFAHYLCNISGQFNTLWEDDKARLQLLKFAEDFLSETDYGIKGIKVGGCNHNTLFYNSTIFSNLLLRKAFCEYMMVRMAHSEKDTI